MSLAFDLKKQRIGAIYGLISGGIFSLVAWGIDAVILSSAHTAHAWIKLIPGFILASLVGCFIGWLSIKISRGFVTILLWVLFGLFLVWLVLWLPFKGAPYLLKVLQPSLINWVDYPLVANISQFRVVGIIVIVFPTALCGLLESNMVDGVILSSHKGAILIFLLICGVLMGMGGAAGDEMTNKHFREPLVVLDQLFEFAEENLGKDVDDVLARRRRLTTLKGLEELIPRSRKLTLIAFDDMLAQMDILVNFEGTWVKCSTIYSQPVNCERIENLPYNYLYHIKVPPLLSEALET
jgi:hypothetical protein